MSAEILSEAGKKLENYCLEKEGKRGFKSARKGRLKLGDGGGTGAWKNLLAAPVDEGKERVWLSMSCDFFFLAFFSLLSIFTDTQECNCLVFESPFYY